MMKGVVKKMAYASPVTIMCFVFAMMAYGDYLSDGDRMNLAFATFLATLAIFGTYFEFSHKAKDAEEKRDEKANQF